MKRLIIILTFIFGLFLNTYSQSIFDASHVYGLYDYYYLDLNPNGKFRLKIGMHGNDIVKGDFKISNDKLFLLNFTKRKKHKKLDWIKERFSDFTIIDSLLIPNYFHDGITIPEDFWNKDSLTEEFMQTDFHSFYSLTLNQNSTYKYKTSIETELHEEDGDWIIDKNIIKLNHDNSDSYLNWITTNNEFRYLDKFIVGLCQNEKDKELMYLIKIKTRR